MENCKMPAVDVEVGMTDVYQATVEAVKPPRTSVWKIIGVTAVFVLCTVASVFFAWHFTSERHSKSELLTGEQSSATTDHQKLLTHISKSTKAAILLHGDKNEKSVLQWVNDVDQSFSKGDLKLENNSIVIPHDGLYFVYSQASFSMSCKPDGEDPYHSHKPLTYHVEWASPSLHPQRKHYLLSGVKSACQSRMNNERVYDFIYLGAVFQLYEGDKLSTMTNYLADIDKHSSKTFFGVFEL